MAQDGQEDKSTWPSTQMVLLYGVHLLSAVIRAEFVVAAEGTSFTKLQNAKQNLIEMDDNSLSDYIHQK